MSVGFRKGEGTGTNTAGKNWQNSKLWNCKRCGGEKFRNKCIAECDKDLVEIYKLDNGSVYEHLGAYLWHRNMDGMYSYSIQYTGTVINIHLGTEVKFLEKMSYEEFVEKYSKQGL